MCFPFIAPPVSLAVKVGVVLLKGHAESSNAGGTPATREESSDAGGTPATRFVKDIENDWPRGIRAGSTATEDQGVRVWPEEPVIEETTEKVARSGWSRARLPKPVKSVMPSAA